MTSGNRLNHFGKTADKGQAQPYLHSALLNVLHQEPRSVVADYQQSEIPATLPVKIIKIQHKMRILNFPDGTDRQESC